jgi:hypothetical protein
MPGLASRQQNFHQGGNQRRTRAESYTPESTARLSAADQLMGMDSSLAIPTLTGVPVVHHYCGGDHAAIALARALINLDLGVPDDWERAKRDPTRFIAATLSRWIEGHGGKAIQQRFGLVATICSFLDEYSERREEDPASNHLYLTVETDRAAYLVLEPTLELLEKQRGVSGGLLPDVHRCAQRMAPRVRSS